MLVHFLSKSILIILYPLASSKVTFAIFSQVSYRVLFSTGIEFLSLVELAIVAVKTVGIVFISLVELAITVKLAGIEFIALVELAVVVVKFVGVEFISLVELAVVTVESTVLIIKRAVTAVNSSVLGLCTEGDVVRSGSGLIS